MGRIHGIKSVNRIVWSTKLHDTVFFNTYHQVGPWSRAPVHTFRENGPSQYGSSPCMQTSRILLYFVIVLIVLIYYFYCLFIFTFYLFYSFTSQQ